MSKNEKQVTLRIQDLVNIMVHVDRMSWSMRGCDFDGAQKWGMAMDKLLDELPLDKGALLQAFGQSMTVILHNEKLSRPSSSTPENN